MPIRFLALAPLALAQLLPVPVQARPLVVELFTSQSCSSCPPAEALLGELAGRPDLLALAFHVTYWNGLGWKDAFAFDGATQRQVDYADRLGDGTFTPQMVVDGRRSVVGSLRADVAAALEAARTEATSAADLVVSRRDGQMRVTVGPGHGAARVVVVGFDRAHRTAVARGENAGRSIDQTNVVRSLRDLGPWEGRPLDLTGPAPAGEVLAVLLQGADGRILGAARLQPGA
ncbi:DUF1223 domain-containing protein [Methylobacterium sp. NEAU 140]|uniref:DUF1223 domain-containing protein n=1 Tax=Methylobacterium sp. NEAU 140 TaxID=3064945 RepID=UPI0027348FE8|nr:DUF1223 domain-containing protein [Methylobacterium sp. NEAU 140]MDP4026873.1 DUF1223 domain-containing protein [Methylobacterium sp. NEAU 140]